MVGLRSFCFCAYYAGFACCTADTWASEVGVLSTDKPILITTRKQVPKGTNGGISPLGCLMSLLGGVYIGLGVLVLDVMWFFINTEVEGKIVTPAFIVWLVINSIFLLLFCGFMGLAGSLLDSLLGATL